jgi:hypothetical protein
VVTTRLALDLLLSAVLIAGLQTSLLRGIRNIKRMQEESGVELTARDRFIKVVNEPIFVIFFVVGGLFSIEVLTQQRMSAPATLIALCAVTFGLLVRQIKRPTPRPYGPEVFTIFCVLLLIAVHFGLSRNLYIASLSVFALLSIFTYRPLLRF